MKYSAISLFVLMCLASSACVSAQARHVDNTPTEKTPAENTPEDNALQNGTSQASPPSDVAIGPQDGITIVALDSDEISKTWRVSSNGDLDLPLVGKIHAAGLTSEQLQQTLIEQLKRFIRDPQVTVYISEYRSQPVTVTGAVLRPGTFQTEGPKTLLAVLTMAGGLQKSPGATVTVTRQTKYGTIPLPGSRPDASGQNNTVVLRLKDVIDSSTPASNLMIQPNDVVTVSTEQQMIYIIGEVIKPGAVELVTQNSVSMLQVLAAAGGLSKLANPHNTEIMRMNSQGLYEKVSTIDLKRLVNGKIEDRLLTAGDIVVVPSSTAKVYEQIAAFAGITTGLFMLTRF